MNVAAASQKIGLDVPVLVAFGCIIVILLAGALYSPEFLSPDYLLQQLQVGAFLGIIASGAMMVILLGHIDLSIPWTVTLGAMMATALERLDGGGRRVARHSLRRSVRRLHRRAEWSGRCLSAGCPR